MYGQMGVFGRLVGGRGPFGQPEGDSDGERQAAVQATAAAAGLRVEGRLHP